MKNETLELLKLIRDAISITIHIKALDAACFVEEARCKGESSYKLTRMRVQQWMLCKQGEKVCDKALAIIHNLKKEEL